VSLCQLAAFGPFLCHVSLSANQSASSPVTHEARLCKSLRTYLSLDYFTTTTGITAFSTTSFPVSPSVTRLTPLIPRDPMMTRSH
jgi:hypothetical protein